MKQGRVSVGGHAGHKQEPIPHAANPTGVAQIGITLGGKLHDGNHTSEGFRTSVCSGHGLRAPMAGTTVHHSGSQGRHK